MSHVMPSEWHAGGVVQRPDGPSAPKQRTGSGPRYLMPNPFYQVYMLGEYFVGCRACFCGRDCDRTNHLPDYAAQPDDVLQRCVGVYICSPANPQGAVADRAYWTDLIALAEQYDFRIFADECYSEIYRDTPPSGCVASRA